MLLGQVWVRGIRFEGQGAWRPLIESLNQIIIFAPVVAVPVFRRQGWPSAWVQPQGIFWRLAIGLGLSFFALALYSALERDAPSWPEAIADVYSAARTHLAVQVLLEDLAIAILFVRLAAALGARAAILGVAALFAAAHVPSMLARGQSGAELLGLLRDFGLGVLVLSTMWRGADIVWLWPVHYSLDMTQFLSRTA